MTATIATAQRSRATGGSGRSLERIGAAFSVLADRIADRSAPFHKLPLGGDIGTLPGESVEAALRWHARQGRVV